MSNFIRVTSNWGWLAITYFESLWSIFFLTDWHNIRHRITRAPSFFVVLKFSCVIKHDTYKCVNLMFFFFSLTLSLIDDVNRSQLCINTAIVYMHRFYVFHSLTCFHRNAIASAALFLAAKVEEQPRKLEHVIKVAHLCLHRDQPPLDTKSEVSLGSYSIVRKNSLNTFSWNSAFFITAIPRTGAGSCFQWERVTSNSRLWRRHRSSTHPRCQVLPFS